MSSRAGKIIESFHEDAITNGDCKRREGGWIISSIEFNSIHLLRHFFIHLAFEGATLRNLLDYALLLYKEGDNIDWLKRFLIPSLAYRRRCWMWICLTIISMNMCCISGASSDRDIESAAPYRSYISYV